MRQAFFDLADDEAEPALRERARRLALEFLELSNRQRVLDAGALGDGGEIGLAGGRRRPADARAAVLLVVEDEDREVRRIEIRKRRQVEKREQQAAVRLEDENLAVRQGERESHADRERVAHRAKRQVRSEKHTSE